MRTFTPEDIYAIAWLGECDLSPDGSRAAFTVTRLDREADEYRSAIWLADLGSGAIRQFTAGAKRDTAPRWSPDGRTLAFLSERGEEKPQLYLIPADGGEARRLTSLPLGAAPAAWSPDGQRIAFAPRTGTPPDPDKKKAKPFRRITGAKYRLNGEGFTYDRRRHLFVVDAAGGEPRQLTDGDWDDLQPAWSPGGREIAFVSARHESRDLDTRTDVWAVAAEGGEARRITATEGANSSPAWSPDGSTIAYIQAPEWPSNHRVMLADTNGGNLRPAAPELDRNCGAASPSLLPNPPHWLPDGSLLTAADDRGTVAFALLAPGQPARWLAPARRTVHGYATKGSTLVFTASDPTHPAELFALDLATGNERRLTALNADWLTGVSLVAPEYFAVPTDAGVEVDCWVMRPAAFEPDQAYPVLLNIHGGPFAQYGETFFDEFQAYTGAGYGVVFCNPRGSSGQDTPFARAPVGDLGGPDYKDVMAAFEAALARLPWADHSRLGVMGGSYGGFMTSWVIGHDDRFAAAVSERAVNDWYLMQGTSDIGATFNRHYLGSNATIQEDLEAVLRQSPITFAKHVTTPVLILHSEDDLRCPISQAEQLWVVLRQLGRDAEFVRFPDENHELSRSGRPSHRVDRFQVILEYLGRKLAPAAANVR